MAGFCVVIARPSYICVRTDVGCLAAWYVGDQCSRIRSKLRCHCYLRKGKTLTDPSSLLYVGGRLYPPSDSVPFYHCAVEKFSTPVLIFMRTLDLLVVGYKLFLDIKTAGSLLIIIIDVVIFPCLNVQEWLQ